MTYTVGSNGTSEKSRYRSPAAQQLHSLICEYCFKSQNQYDASKKLLAVKTYLTELIEINPAALLELSINNYSHLVDVLHLPYIIPHSKRDIGLSSAIAEEGFRTLMDAYKKAIDKGKISESDYVTCFLQSNKDHHNLMRTALVNGNNAAYDIITAELQKFRNKRLINDAQYADQFTSLSTNNFTPLHDAVMSGKPELYDKIVADLAKLRAENLISNHEYALQFSRENSNGFTLLHSAIYTGSIKLYNRVLTHLESLRPYLDDDVLAKQFTLKTKTKGFTPLFRAVMSGNWPLCKKVLSDMGRFLNQEQIREQLLQHTHKNSNIFHIAVFDSPRKSTPNPFLIERLNDAFYTHFNQTPGEARNKIELLLQERDANGHTPHDTCQYDWATRIIEQSDENPIRPTTSL